MNKFSELNAIISNKHSKVWLYYVFATSIASIAIHLIAPILANASLRDFIEIIAASINFSDSYDIFLFFTIVSQCVFSIVIMLIAILGAYYRYYSFVSIVFAFFNLIYIQIEKYFGSQEYLGYKRSISDISSGLLLIMISIYVISRYNQYKAQVNSSDNIKKNNVREDVEMKKPIHNGIGQDRVIDTLKYHYVTIIGMLMLMCVPFLSFFIKRTDHPFKVPWILKHPVVVMLFWSFAIIGFALVAFGARRAKKKMKQVSCDRGNQRNW